MKNPNLFLVTFNCFQEPSWFNPGDLVAKMVPEAIQEIPIVHHLQVVKLLRNKPFWINFKYYLSSMATNLFY